MKAQKCEAIVVVFSAIALGLVACSTPSAPQTNEPPSIEADEPVPPAGIPKKYAAPHGFNGDEFGMTLSQLKVRHPRLAEIGEPIAVAWRGQTHSVDFSGCLEFDKSGGCRNPIISADVDRNGTSLFAEYYVAARYPGYTDGYRFEDTGGVLVPVLIDVCAKYPGWGDRVIPNTLADDARVCAFRAFHHTYLDEYANADETHAEEGDSGSPMYQRVFSGLVNAYGYPQHYRPRGRIVIELTDGTRLTSDPTPYYVDYHWGRGYSVTIDYAFNPKDGAGVVFIANAAARDYAQKRHDTGDVNFVLWRLSQRGGLNHKGIEWSFQNGSLAITRFDSRVEAGRLSERVRALFAARPQ